jgi:hypothetical protein
VYLNECINDMLNRDRWNKLGIIAWNMVRTLNIRRVMLTPRTKLFFDQMCRPTHPQLNLVEMDSERMFPKAGHTTFLRVFCPIKAPRDISLIFVILVLENDICTPARFHWQAYVAKRTHSKNGCDTCALHRHGSTCGYCIKRRRESGALITYSDFVAR